MPTAMLTPRTAAALAALDRRAVWVPATTRSTAQYARLDLGRRLGVAPRYVVAACGGVLLVDGVPDPAWAAWIERLLADAAPRAEVADVLARHLACLPPGAAGPVRDVDGALLVVRAPAPAAWHTGLAAECDARGWRVVVHGTEVHVLPRGLGKGRAVDEVRRRLGSTRLLAAGDSPLDADLLRAADAGIQPVDGRLHAAGWRADHVAVTAGTGLRAGEEIVAWLLARCP
ncbi:HAD family hydrolase [Actinomycetospora cinnamomea]|uniref:Uncharacterized protein n=1 Tax=Actinomycetospora cinnamomea TaxID=663609 RepID=A0A2U1FPW9_9PSEU|nr:HAD family hydrolase [Actinomycetospora cinnamomea]PVZ14218.1 hypothetical protein C8D89_10182 [Actinomycetospora cinnamomea]